MLCSSGRSQEFFLPGMDSNTKCYEVLLIVNYRAECKARIMGPLKLSIPRIEEKGPPPPLSNMPRCTVGLGDGKIWYIVRSPTGFL